jgi:hypothetical protein
MDSRIITPIPDRTDMALVAEKQFRQTGNAIEIGVWRGEFAAHNLRFWKGRYYLCDLWAHREDGTADKNMEDPGTWEEVKANALLNVSFANDRVILSEGPSLMMADYFKDKVFDWIYLDTLHDYKSVKAELAAWWPKLRTGGLFSGDDYGDQSLRWQDKYGGVARAFNWGVIEAVNEFAAEQGKQLHVTWMNDKTMCPAWYLIK